MDSTMMGSYFTPDQGSYEALRKISALNLKAFTKLAGLQFELATLGIKSSVASAKLIAASKDYDQLYTHESKIASQYGSRVFEISRETTDVLIKSGDELNAILSGIFTVAKDEMAIIATPVVAPVVEKKAVKATAPKPAKKKSVKK
jgi:phasin family protein